MSYEGPLAALAPAPPGLRRTALALLAVGLLLKVVLLFTSQSMPDGDEAVEGIMAIHVLDRGVHPIYPYGVRYGAGAGIETHLAAGIFVLFGPSGPALKAAGLLVWTACLVLVFALARDRYGERAALAAALLFSFSPQAAEWSLKVGGGHLPAVLLTLFALALAARPAGAWAAALLLPFAAFAHPIVLPACGALALRLVVEKKGRTRIAFAAGLALSALAASAALWPKGTSVWNPAAASLDLPALGRALAGLPTAFFAPNLNSRLAPSGPVLVVSLAWLSALAVSCWRLRRDLWILGVLLAAASAVFLVNPAALAPRHLLLAWPLACVAIGAALASRPGRAGIAAVFLLATGGAAVQAIEIGNPCVHGPDPQDRGLPRAEVRRILDDLRAAGVAHVYCTDPMLPWNLIFESRETILARSADPEDRFPEYPESIDRARRAGRPVALVVNAGRLDPRRPQRFAVILRPSPGFLRANFPESPAAGK